MALQSRTPGTKSRRRIDSSHYLYIAVIGAVLAGITVGLAAPEFAVGLKPIGDAFVLLIKMMIAPIIFCTIVLGVGSIAKAATVGKVGGLALLYFIVMSTFALGIGLVVGNLIHPGEGLDISGATYDAGTTEAKTTQEFVLGIIPTSLLSALVDGNILQVLFVALLVGFALQKMGPKGTPILGAIRQIQGLVFRILAMIMWIAPIGAFGAIAAVVGATGVGAIFALGTLMVAFYITCILFIVVVLGSLLWAVTRVSIFKVMKYLGREYLLIVSTSSSEVVLPRLIAKMEHAGVSKPVAGITIPTGYSFNLDGTAIYLTMASLFIASAMGTPLSLGEQVGLLLFMMVASKGAAGVTGAGLATLAGGLQAHRPDLVDGVGVIVGIDRFMSEARALTNFTGNAVATLLVGTWTKQLDRDQLRHVLAGERPFDEATMSVDDHLSPDERAEVEREAGHEVDPAHEGRPSTAAIAAIVGDLERRVAASVADVVVVDLEDGVAPDDKGRARRALAAAADAGLRPWVRIGDAASDEWRADVALLHGRDLVAGVVLAKVEAREHVRRTVDALDGGLPIVALLESARGVEAALELAEAPGVVRLAFGSGDFRRDTGAADDPLALLYARSRLVSASRAAGLPGPVDGPTVPRDADLLATASRHAASLGMTGRLCLREEQVVAVNAALSPTGEELAWADDVLATLERCGIRDGSDLPRIARARAVRDAASAFGIEADAAPPRSDYAD